jgi:hypothetical protein
VPQSGVGAPSVERRLEELRLRKLKEEVGGLLSLEQWGSYNNGRELEFRGGWTRVCLLERQVRGDG